MYGMELEKEASEKSPRHYVEFLNAAAKSTFKTFNLMEVVARKIHREANPIIQLKEVLAELRVQCSCKPLK
jgi:hypothetical protein